MAFTGQAIALSGGILFHFGSNPDYMSKRSNFIWHCTIGPIGCMPQEGRKALQRACRHALGRTQSAEKAGVVHSRATQRSQRTAGGDRPEVSA